MEQYSEAAKLIGFASAQKGYRTSGCKYARLAVED